MSKLERIRRSSARSRAEIDAAFAGMATDARYRALADELEAEYAAAAGPEALEQGESELDARARVAARRADQ